ncbi:MULTISPECIES: RNA polymerase sigma factor [Brevibacillus]|jgi:RNA polymerase sigma-70 factor (ECF subfamily)|uniref:RNA polymerase ECF-type sigma factor n=1 Tax=Brevibacillus borstelensis AK1 TaxID=1300222 RepID=M8D3F1_9BACL|nr:sigma-70 family RNA polymerase sigma factor [Brevibacillus borstelensis]EMT50784.1 RNA polymerase ECF-type sigma factor [Brevibacillus borstelensis AK1]KKX55901.1 DNA-directed RNA polymerase subunit sigma [Brevibacillus borstelensis cifa_chp40]MBE5396723.1 sigma-70 family RNA polymerase sigma factor [Brevibacillus borstelensis]MCC0564461.1 sigma-70 family RNA polymerase sigma factor [Brevibacillus borstelensis]MCM3471185.1 sigma-70 family RNA polymerase sigma factor [Brevibacillus borstelen
MGEAELIRKAQSGDHEALVELLRTIETSVYRSAFYILGNEQDALDAAQEALIRIYRKIDTYQEKAKFSTWVQRVVSNVCMDKFRAKKETVSIDEHELIIPDRNNVEDEILLNSLSQDIKAAIGKLPKQYRMVVVLRYLEDFSYQEIAEALELPLNTVKSYLFRARQQLQELLHDYEKGGIG